MELKLDVDRLLKEIEEINSEHPPVMQGDSFGGWSLLSASGSHKDGWAMGHTCFKLIDGVAVADPEKLRKIKYKPSRAHRNFTDIAKPYLREVTEKINAQK